jgi:hypothetical protein
MYLFAVAYEPFGPVDYSLPSDKTYSEMYNEDEQYVTYKNGGTIGGGGDNVYWCSCGTPLDPDDHTELKRKVPGNAFDDTNIKHICGSPLNGEYVLLLFAFILLLSRLFIHKNINVQNK